MNTPPGSPLQETEYGDEWPPGHQYSYPHGKIELQRILYNKLTSYGVSKEVLCKLHKLQFTQFTLHRALIYDEHDLFRILPLHNGDKAAICNWFADYDEYWDEIEFMDY